MADIEKVIKELEHVRQTDFDMSEPTKNAIDNVLELLKEQEAVVHCGDCKHYNKKRKWCNYLSEMYDQGEEWFCADGERKEGR